MQIEQATLETCGQATGVVVVIDVIRAFTTAAFAFAAGVEEIALVSEIEPANPEYPAADLACCLDLDRFDFAMPVRRHNDRLLMRPAR